MPLRVVLGLAESDATLQQLRAMLTEGDAYDVVDARGLSTELIDAVVRCDAEIVVMSENLGPMPVLELARQLGLAQPSAAVVLLLSPDSQISLQMAMEAGVRGVVGLPLQYEDLHLRMTNAATWSTTMRQHLTGEVSALAGTGTMVAVCGAKGGVGASVLAVHLALLASGGRRSVCLVDLDLQQGDIPSLLDLTHRRDITDLVGIASELGGRALDEVLFSHTSGMRVLLAPQDGERGEDVTNRVARAVLGALKARFDVVVVDCGSTLTEATAIAVEMSDRVLVLATPDMLAVRAARRTVRLWERLQLRKPEDVLMVLNRSSRTAELQPELARRIAGIPMAAAFLPASFRALELSINNGDPTMLTDGRLRGAIADLGRELGVLDAVPARSRRRRPRGESGQVAVEFLGTFLLVVAIVVALVQGVLTGMTYVLAGQSANAAARVAVPAGASYDQVRRAAVESLPGGWQRMNPQVEFDPAAGRDPDGSVTVRVNVPLLVPGLISTPFRVSASAAMVREGRR